MITNTQFSGDDVFLMTWAVLDAFATMKRKHGIDIPQSSVVADAVRTRLVEGWSPIGLEVDPSPPGGKSFYLRGNEAGEGPIGTGTYGFRERAHTYLKHLNKPAAPRRFFMDLLCVVS